MKIFLDPGDPDVIAQARRDGISDEIRSMPSVRRSTV